MEATGIWTNFAIFVSPARVSQMSERFPKHAQEDDDHLRDIKSKINSLKAVKF